MRLSKLQRSCQWLICERGSNEAPASSDWPLLHLANASSGGFGASSGAANVTPVVSVLVLRKQEVNYCVGLSPGVWLHGSLGDKRRLQILDTVFHLTSLLEKAATR